MYVFRKEQPTLARGKVLKYLKETYKWELSDKRLKECMEKYSLNTVPPAIPELPRNDKFNDILTSAVHEFIHLERDFFLSLSPTECHTLNPKFPEPIFAASQLRHYVEILLTLKGITPSTLIGHSTEKGSAIFTRMVESCFKPVFKKYKLSHYGFSLIPFDHKISMGGNQRMMGGYVFADLRSEKWNLVEFFLLSTAEIRAIVEPANYGPGSPYQEGIANSVGYPLQWPDQFPNKKLGQVSYLEETECKILRENTGKDVDCVTGLEFYHDFSDKTLLHEVYIHFESCRTAAALIGLDLKLEFEEDIAVHAWRNKGRFQDIAYSWSG